MKADFWHTRWENNQIGFHQQNINTYLQNHWSSLNLEPGSPVFVPLCGKSKDMLWLRNQGHSVLGIEVSPVAVKAFFKENDLIPTVDKEGLFTRYEVEDLIIYCGDFFDLTKADLKDYPSVFDRASQIALPKEMRRPYADHLIHIMPNNAQSLLVTMEYPQDEMDGPPFAVHEKEIRALYAQRFHIEMLLEKDIYAENPRFAKRGLTQLTEKVYRLS